MRFSSLQPPSRAWRGCSPRRCRPIKRVLIIHGGPEAFPGNARFDAAITSVLFSHPAFEVDYYAEFLENEEFGELADSSLRDYIRTKFRDRPLDVVIVNTAPAVEFALRYRTELFPDVPIVFVASTPPAEVLRGEIPGVTGVVRDPSQTETLELALKLHPGTRRVHVVAYAPAVDGYQERVVAALAGVSPGVKHTYANEPTLTEALATIRQLPADSLLFFARYSPSPSVGRVIMPDEVLAQIAAVSPVPIYNSSESNIGSGVLGGMMRSEVKTAIRVGEITVRILEGAKPEDIPIEAASMSPIFDWRQMQRAGASLRRRCRSAEIRFRVQTVWELYGRYIMDDRGGRRPAAVDRRAALAAHAPAPRRKHHPGTRSLAAHQLRPHPAHGRPADQRPGSSPRRHRPRSARRRQPEAGLRFNGREQSQGGRGQHPGC